MDSLKRDLNEEVFFHYEIEKVMADSGYAVDACLSFYDTHDTNDSTTGALYNLLNRFNTSNNTHSTKTSTTDGSRTHPRARAQTILEVDGPGHFARLPLPRAYYVQPSHLPTGSDAKAGHQGQENANDVDVAGAGSSCGVHLPIGKTLLKRRILASQGYNVVSVPWYEWNALESEVERKTYLRKKLGL